MWAQAALQGCAGEVAKTGSGSRNNALNRAAYRLGGMVARRWLERSSVERALLAAADANGMVADDGGRDRAVATIKSGLDAGMNNPHPDLPDRPDFSVEGMLCAEGEAAFDDGASGSAGAGVGGNDACVAGDVAGNAHGVTLDDFYFTRTCPRTSTSSPQPGRCGRQ